MAERGGDVLLGAHPPADAARQLPLASGPHPPPRASPYSADRLLRSNESAHQTCQMQNLTACWDLQQGGRSTAP
jgi:hypothetical protein